MTSFSDTVLTKMTFWEAELRAHGLRCCDGSSGVMEMFSGFRRLCGFVFYHCWASTAKHKSRHCSHEGHRNHINWRNVLKIAELQVDREDRVEVQPVCAFKAKSTKSLEGAGYEFMFRA